MTTVELRAKIHEVIFGTDTPAGKNFDLVLIVCILASVAVLMLESIDGLDRHYAMTLKAAEWAFTLMFTLEYALRIYSSPKPWRYVRSFYGVIDLISIAPTYLSLIFPGASYILVIRLLRILRVFRVLKLMRYIEEANLLLRVMVLSRRKIIVFFLVVLVLATVFGSLMYLVEGAKNGFTSIPASIYWTIVTITTVGYGDITPQTVLGKVISSLAMLTGYSIIAVPTGIFTAELAQEIQRNTRQKPCRSCFARGHDIDALYCKKCGEMLHQEGSG